MKSFTLLLAAAGVSSSEAFAINHRSSLQSAKRSGSTLYSSTDGQSSALKEALKLREKAAKVRAELASLEGKSLDQVEEEAAKEKEQRERRITESKAASEAAMFKRKSSSDKTRGLPKVYVPNNVEEQSLQAAMAIERAFQDGITRQTVRLALVNTRETEEIGVEDEDFVGGAKQMYRESGNPLTTALLNEVRAVATDIQSEEEKKKGAGKEALPPTIKAQDILDFDGSALITSEAAAGPSGDVQALVFPNTDVKYLKDIEEIHKALGKERLFLLVNPFWKNVESWGFNILAPNAKKKAQGVVFDCDGGAFEETYVLKRFSARGEDCVALKAYPNDWEMFAFLEDYSFGRPIPTAMRLGSSKEEPKLSDFSELLNEREEFKLNKTMRQLNRNNY
uniref:DUF1995 domain-containing protein n=1 Tax=Chaetoceros debilis TaxID=122233 RepID=A0A7S3Q2X3_9STRA|mmetsp:Transcript_6586/g.9621  ORF Transcript_6586/g.9621 Transcript_6586/m.9621 type:complete len:394 (+) Transcript_6586:158-1339(+)